MTAVFRKLTVHPCSASLLRTDDHNRSVCIIQKISLYQFFKIPGFHLTLQELERRDRFHMDERFLIIIEPAVKELQSVHKTSRIISKISLTEAEFVVIDSGTQ